MRKKIRSYFRELPIRGFCVFVLLGGLWSFSNAEAAIKVFSSSGTVEVRLKGKGAWRALQESDRLKQGDQLRSREGSSAALVCEGDGSELYLAPETHLEIEDCEFSKSQQQRICRFRLLKGTLSANVAGLGFGRYRIGEQTLDALGHLGMPRTLLVKLEKLAGQEYAKEEPLLADIKKLIGGRLSVRYTLPLLEYAATGQEIFTIGTEEVLVGANYASVLTMTVDEEIRQTEVRVEQGRVKMHRLNDKGLVRIFGLSDVQAQEGLQFDFNTSGGFARVTVEDCSVSAETNVPVSDAYALIGGSENLVNIRNEADSPAVQIIREDTASPVELEEEREALFGIPSHSRLSFEASELVNASFGFCRQYSSFVFATQGCLRIKGQEECCGEVAYTKVAPQDIPERRPENAKESPAAAADTSDTGGGFIPPTTPPIQPGSPILPQP